MREVFEYPFSNLDPITSDHVDPPAVAVFETLLSRGPRGRAQPGLCSAWSVSDDQQTWSMTVRPGARFHSGDPCDAAAVARALESCRWGDGWARQLWYWDPVDEVAVVAPDTIEFRLRYPCRRLPVLLWGTHTAICNPDRRWRASTQYTPGLVDGTGPYRVTAASVEHVSATRVRGWGPPTSRPLSDEITWLAEPEEGRRRTLMTSGQADIVRGARREWFDDAADPALAEWSYVEHAENSQYYLALDFDDQRGFGDKAVRQAIEASIDRPRLVREAFAGPGDARRSPVPAADQLATSCDPASSPRLTMRQSEIHLEAAGWERQSNGLWSVDGSPLVIDCVGQDTPEGRSVAQALQRQLLAVGIVLELRFVPVFASFYAACADRPAAFVSKWLWPDAIEAVMGFTQTSCIADSGANWQGASASVLDRAYDDFLRSRTDLELSERARALQEVFMDQLPYIPLCAPRAGYAVRSNIAGYHPSSDVLYPGYADLHELP